MNNHQAASPDKPAETLVGISFDNAFRSSEFLLAAKGFAAKKGFVLKDAVIISKNTEGQSSVLETVDMQPGRSAMSLGMWGGLIGLLVGGPIGWLAGAAVGGSMGAGVAKLVDVGIRDEWVEWFKTAGQPGSTIVALLVTDIDRDAFVAEVTRFPGAKLVYANLESHTLDRIKEALGQDPSQDPYLDVHREVLDEPEQVLVIEK
jgi:uncharacterized membrane protein